MRCHESLIPQSPEPRTPIARADLDFPPLTSIRASARTFNAATQAWLSGCATEMSRSHGYPPLQVDWETKSRVGGGRRKMSRVRPLTSMYRLHCSPRISWITTHSSSAYTANNSGRSRSSGLLVTLELSQLLIGSLRCQSCTHKRRKNVHHCGRHLFPSGVLDEQALRDAVGPPMGKRCAQESTEVSPARKTRSTTGSDIALPMSRRK